MKKLVATITLIMLLVVELMTPMTYAVEGFSETEIIEDVAEEIIEETDGAENEEKDGEITEEEITDEEDTDEEYINQETLDKEEITEEGEENEDNLTEDNDIEESDTDEISDEETANEETVDIESDEEIDYDKLRKESRVAVLAEKIGIDWENEKDYYAQLAGVEGEYRGTRWQNESIRVYLVEHLEEIVKAKTTTGDNVEESTLTGLSLEEINQLTGEIFDGNEGSKEDTELNSESITGTQTYDNVTVNVVAPEGSFYSGTKLKIEPIKWFSLRSLKNQLVENQEQITEDSTVVAFDISFIYSGEEVQPLSGTVQVSFNYETNDEFKEAEEEDGKEVKVYHINDKDEEGKKLENKEIEKVEIVELNEGEVIVEAENFSIYTIVTQVAEEGILSENENQLANFVYGEISIARPDILSEIYPNVEGFTIMDRNLGASEVYTGKPNVKTYGFYYQRGNNYGFAAGCTGTVSECKDDVTVNAVTDKAVWNNDGSYENGGYSSKTFIKVGYDGNSDYWEGNKHYNNLWGGSGDNIENGYRNGGVLSSVNRQGPCPEGRHVPSFGEWKMLIIYYMKTKYPEISFSGDDNIGRLNLTTNAEEIRTYFKLPYSSVRDQNKCTTNLAGNGYGYYWTSSPYSLNDSYPYKAEMIGMSSWYFSSDADNVSYDGFRAKGVAVRCFKNTYSGTGDMFTITYDFNGGSGSAVNQTVKSGEVAERPIDPVKEGLVFSGWYENDSLIGDEFDFSTPITGNKTLYAKWNLKICVTYDDIDEDTIKVTGIKSDDVSCKENLIIPNIINGKRVIEIGKNAFKGNGLTGTLTFMEPSYITNIGDSAFNNNTIDGELRIPDSIEYIGKDTFKHAFYRSNIGAKLTFGEESRLINIGSEAFAWNKLKGELKIPRGLTEINDEFYVNKFTSIDFNGTINLKRIGDYAFSYTSSNYWMSSLEGELRIPDSVESVGKGAFEGAFKSSSSTTRLIFGEESQIKSIGNHAFEQNKIKGVLRIPRGLTGIEQEFSRNSFTGIDFNGTTNLKKIGDYAFSYTSSNYFMSSLEGELKIPDSVESIGESAFKGAFNSSSSTTRLIFGEESQIKSIGNHAFEQNKIKGVLRIPRGLTGIEQEFSRNSFTGIDFNGTTNLKRIGDYAFSYTSPSLWMSSLEGELRIPDSVESIGESAFQGAFNNSKNPLLSLGNESKLNNIGQGAFSNNGLTGIVLIPISVSNIYTGAFNYNKIKTLLFTDGGNTTIYGDAFCNNNGTVQGYKNGATILALPTDCVNWNDEYLLTATFVDATGDITKQSVTYGNYLIKPNLVLSGDNIIKWYLEGSDTEFDFGNTKIYDNITLYGRREEYGVENYCFKTHVKEDDGTVRIDGLITNAPNECKENIVIPNRILGLGWVSEIKDSAFGRSDLTGTLTFQNPSHITRIGTNSFREIKKLSGILNIPDSVTSVGYNAFDRAFNWNTENRLTGGMGIITLLDSAFKENNFKGLLKIPSGITTISQQYKSNAFTGIDFNGAQITSIGNEAFKEMFTLQGELNIPNTVTSVGVNAFYRAFSGKTENRLTGGMGIITLGDSAFKENNFKGLLKIPSGITTISQQYRGNAFTGIDFNGAQITSIGNEAFREMKTLQGELNIPNTVTSIGVNAFYRAFSGKTENRLTGGMGIITLGDSAFKENNFKGLLKIPSGITAINQQYRGNAFTGIDFNGAQIITIGDNSFREMKTLQGELNIPNTVTSIGDYAFYRAFSGETENRLTGGMGITTLGGDVFKENNFKGLLKIPSGITTINQQYRGNAFTGIDFNGAQITTIGNEAFKDMKTLEGKLVIPSSLSSIGYQAFYNNTIDEIYFQTVGEVNIGSNAFCYNGTILGYQNLATINANNKDCVTWQGKYPHNVTYVTYGGKPSIGEIVLYGDTIENTSPIKTGYDFKGWYLTGDIFFPNTTAITGNLTLYAKFQKDIIFKLIGNGNKILSGTQQLDEYIITGTVYNDDYKYEFTFPEIKANEDTPTIIGYSTGADIHIAEYQSGNKIELTGSKIYYAQSQETYNQHIGLFIIGTGVQSLSNYKKYCTPEATYNGSRNDSCIIQTPTITLKSGYNNARFYTGTTEYSQNTISINSDKTFIAIGNPIIYNISYILNGGVLDNKKISYTVEEGFDIGNPNRTGYIFLGWTGTNWPIETKNLFVDTGTYGDLSLYAQWNKLSKVEFKDGDIVITGYVVESGAMIELPDNPKKTGYEFVKWNGLPEDMIVRGEDLSITAEWKSLAPVVPQPAAGGGRIIDNSTKDSSNQEHDSADLDQSSGNTTTGDNEESLFEWAHSHNITTLSTVERANPDGVVLRGHLAKMLVNYMINVKGEKLPEEIPNECKRNDEESVWESKEIKDYAEKACALGVMGINTSIFEPNGLVSRAQFGTTLSRILWGDRYNVKDTSNIPYYKKHLEALKENKILEKTDSPEETIEIRKWIWLMLRRTKEIKQ